MPRPRPRPAPVTSATRPANPSAIWGGTWGDWLVWLTGLGLQWCPAGGDGRAAPRDTARGEVGVASWLLQRQSRHGHKEGRRADLARDRDRISARDRATEPRSSTLLECVLAMLALVLEYGLGVPQELCGAALQPMMAQLRRDMQHWKPRSITALHNNRS